jgi:hypothetical protein
VVDAVVAAASTAGGLAAVGSVSVVVASSGIPGVATVDHAAVSDDTSENGLEGGSGRVGIVGGLLVAAAAAEGDIASPCVAGKLDDDVDPLTSPSGC